MTDDQLTRQVLQGGGNMPAYGKSLTPPQATALVAFGVGRLLAAAPGRR